MKYEAIKHSCSGHFIHLENTRAFVYEKGAGETVICFHGVPASSFLYRKLIHELAAKNLRAISFDLLGMGLSDRPEDFNYNWTNLGEWTLELINALELTNFHIILHDIGGPIACEIISKIPERVLSVTILNTLLTNLPEFKKPFPMSLFEKKYLGEFALKTTTAFVFKYLMYLRGIHNKEAFNLTEAQAYVDFLNGDDNGKSFLKIMRNFETTQEKEADYISSLTNLSVPKQIIWGINDKGLTLKEYGIPLQKKLNIPLIPLPGSHFLQEDYAHEISEYFVQLILK